MAEMDNLNSEFESTLKSLSSWWDKAKDGLQESKTDATSKYDQLKLEFDALKSKYDKAQARIDHIDGQLAETVSRLETMSKSETKEVDAMKLLDVYLVLMEQVFESGPHVRLLLILHGDKETWTLPELVQASGISALKVRQAMFELRNAQVLEYNEDTDMITLTQRFM